MLNVTKHHITLKKNRRFWDMQLLDRAMNDELIEDVDLELLDLEE